MARGARPGPGPGPHKARGAGPGSAKRSTQEQPPQGGTQQEPGQDQKTGSQQQRQQQQGAGDAPMFTPESIKEARISYGMEDFLAHMFILYYVWSSLLFMEDTTIRTFGQYVWWIFAITMTLFSFARWLPDMEITLIAYILAPLNGLLWVNMWLTPFNVTHNALYDAGPAIVQFSYMGTISSALLPIVFFHVFIILRRNLFGIVSRDYDLAFPGLKGYISVLNSALTTVIFVVFWYWFVRPVAPCFFCTDMETSPSMCGVFLIAVLHNWLFVTFLLAAGVGYRVPTYWQTVMDKGVNIWMMPDAQPELYFFH